MTFTLPLTIGSTGHGHAIPLLMKLRSSGRARAGEPQPLAGFAIMHGVPRTLTGLADFNGARFVEMRDLENIVYFRFAHDGSSRIFEIGVEGEWQLRTKDNSVVATGSPRTQSQELRELAGVAVAATETRPPKSVCLSFTDGRVLEIFDSSDQYESFCIPHANVYI